jgi:type II secretory pathway pseudopilin PulG
MIEKNNMKKHGMEKSSKIDRTPAVVSALRVLKLVLLVVVLIMFLNLAGLFSLLRGYFYLLVIAIFGFSLMILATRALRHIYRGDERANKSLPKSGWQFAALILVLIMGAAFPSASRTISMNQERICEEDLAKLGHAVERYAAEKGRLPDSLEQLIQEKFLDYIPKVGRSAVQYRVDTAGGKSSFVLNCPDPGKLLKARGLLPARKCKGIQYIRGQGLVVETE